MPLGEGDADFPMVFKLLQENNYTSNYILQTARANNDDHSSALSLYKCNVEDWIKTSES